MLKYNVRHMMGSMTSMIGSHHIQAAITTRKEGN